MSVSEFIEDALVATRAHAFDHAWHEVNARGSTPNPNDPEDIAYNAAITDALRAIEALGGMDPAALGEGRHPPPRSATPATKT